MNELELELRFSLALANAMQSAIIAYKSQELQEMEDDQRSRFMANLTRAHAAKLMAIAGQRPGSTSSPQASE
jgi:hypothetical protein